MTFTEQVKKRIESVSEGEIILTSDFSDIISTTSARKYLGRLTDDGIIRRVFDGVYEKPKYSKLLEEYLPTDPEKVAYAIARRYHWTIAPCGDIALNKLGLTTQVPVVWSYVSDGPYRNYSWDNVRITFKHKANREISYLSERTILVVEAIRTLGKERITDDIIEKLKRKLDENDKALIINESSACSEWIYETIRKVCT
ncbi:MAG: hypothetical protein IKH50_13550 [Oscillospiraceae bacterium]|nr:hypothetical protein [Oscillospiraceae bacterium]